MYNEHTAYQAKLEREKKANEEKRLREIIREEISKQGHSNSDSSFLLWVGILLIIISIILKFR